MEIVEFKVPIPKGMKIDSEDEKIRKGLIDYFNNFHLQTFAGLDPKKILAWLEKQGEWTIQDAKNGDILACNNDILSICIFSHFDGINNKYDSFLCHCGLEGEGLEQELNINGYHDDSTGYVPATKRQRDLLFQKIKEAGYEWDAEKKELKKIEQNPINNQFTLEQADILDKHIDKFLEENPHLK